ncbi:nucleolar GTP-binding protein 2 [Cricetulus griseus]|uniref:Nucleolar GTP-binding protein 2 n=1 Tax=Cricetulus griseus TaxID=10029 RepID=G3HE17_CRIGR|nr:nucleolar GTP-binding protein 2 [Cricetulus griseus]XP_027255037.1 nucleolar GTP-binding protein 2 [Cricetulus griseus]EGW00546.1 Nucleolar GTP-binding protein 2 [Cricetulus griseus]ERE85649.1 nucleolar GTP-binding protein 2 [Cricetulus griseus]
MVKPKYKGRSTINRSAASTNPDRVQGAGGQNMRDRATIRRLNMYRQKERRNNRGKVIKPLQYQSTVASGTVARVEPNIKWFGNTRVIKQASLQKFQEEMDKVMKDPYKVVMKQSKLPMSLLHDRVQPHNAKVHILDTESFESTFGPKSQRKRPNLFASDMQSLLENAEMSTESYDQGKDRDLVTEDTGVRNEAQEEIYKKGQSKRIWGELYKVIDSSDVVVQVLDARDPMGTRSPHIEAYLKKEKPWKHLIFVLNKCDLVPTWATKRWVAVLSRDYPTLAFHASLTNPFGKGAFIQLLRQFGKLHTDKKQISVGFIGYPNVGKSSVINTLRSKKVCNVAPIAGETKVWQYITLMRRIFLIDCPGVVYPSEDSETDIVLKGVVQVEKIKAPQDHIGAVLERAKPEYISKTYKIDSWENAEDFLEKLAFRTGKLLKGGEPDLQTVGKMVLNDWQRGRIPFFVKPPNAEPPTAPQLPPSSPLEVPTEITENNPEEEISETIVEKSDSVIEKEPEADHPQDSNSEMQQILARVRQNFGKINVGPQFSADDLVPVELSDMEEDLESLSAEEEEQDQEQPGEDAEEAPSQDSQEEPVEKDTKAVIRALDEKIAKYQKFLNKAKAKKFSAIRISKDLSEKVFAKYEEEKKRSVEVSDAAPTKKGRKRSAHMEEEPSSKAQRMLTCKERRRAARQQQSKKVGVRYYETHNVKNRNRNKKKTNDSEGQKHRHKKLRQKQ